MSKTSKVLATIFISLYIVVCVTFCTWWAVVYFNDKDKLAVKTYEVDLQTLADGTKQALVDAQLFRNEDNSGLSAFEVRWNYILDENRTAFYSQGTQLIGDDFSYKVVGVKQFTSKKWGVLNKRVHSVYLGRTKFTGNLEEYSYMSGNDYYDTLNDTSPINDDTFMRLTLKTGSGDDPIKDYSIYGMKFKGPGNFSCRNGSDWTNEAQYNAVSKGYTYDYSCVEIKVSSGFGTYQTSVSHVFRVHDYNEFLVSLYNTVKDLPAGTNHYINIKFNDLFNYYEYDGKTYGTSPIEDKDLTGKLSQLAESYWAVKVTIHDEGLTKASESLFNSVRGSSTYNTTNNYSEDLYFMGRTNIRVDETMVDFINIVDNKYSIRLKQSFVEHYSKYYDLIVLSVDLDLDRLEKQNIEVVGYSADSGFNNFVVHNSNISEVQNV